jgi:hypothetical protein
MELKNNLKGGEIEKVIYMVKIQEIIIALILVSLSVLALQSLLNAEYFSAILLGFIVYLLNKEYG